MDGLHSLLFRQIRRHFGDMGCVPQEWKEFVEAVDKAYSEFDADRTMLERSLELASNELLERNQELRADLARRIQAEEALVKLSKAVEQAADSVFITNEDGVIEYVNPAFEQLTGYRREDVIGKTPRILKSGRHPERYYKRVWELLLAGKIFRGEFINRKRNGDLYYEEKAITPVRDSAGSITHFVSTGRDITERKRAEETIRHLAYHDSLTGLPNRQLLKDRLTVAVAQARRKEQLLAVMFLDLDRFKAVNDAVGHAGGDDLLKLIAKQLGELAREGDTLARIGGDEFTLLLPGIARVRDAVEVGERILDCLRQPQELAGDEFHTTTSIGIAVFPNDGEDAETLLRNADIAMYRAKEQGRDTLQLYTPAMNAGIAERRALEGSLRHALDRGELVVYYQPLANVRSGQIVGTEALVRWNHPERGLVAPGEFIPVAEETGLILPIGEFVLRAACAQNKAWQDAGVPPVRVAVNLSARQFVQPSLIDMVASVLTETGLDARYLELEITESFAMENADLTIQVLSALQEMGIIIAIDDFGTGYSSLSYLKNFPIHTLKIDRSFIKDLSVDANDAAIAAATIAMAHSLNLSVTAEGVETAEQLAFLKERHCDEYQGYLLAQPMPAEAMAPLLMRGKASPRAQAAQAVG